MFLWILTLLQWRMWYLFLHFDIQLYYSTVWMLLSCANHYHCDVIHLLRCSTDDTTLDAMQSGVWNIWAFSYSAPALASAFIPYLHPPLPPLCFIHPVVLHISLTLCSSHVCCFTSNMFALLTWHYRAINVQIEESLSEYQVLDATVSTADMALYTTCSLKSQCVSQ